MTEKRYAPRVEVDSVARILTGSREVRGRVVDVSARGVALETPSTVTLERFVRLSAVLIPGDPPIDLDAIVLRRERRGTIMRWGLQFHEAPAHVLNHIVEFVRSKTEAATVPGHRPTAPIPIRRHTQGEDCSVKGLYEQALNHLEG